MREKQKLKDLKAAEAAAKKWRLTKFINFELCTKDKLQYIHLSNLLLYYQTMDHLSLIAILCSLHSFILLKAKQ